MNIAQQDGQKEGEDGTGDALDGASKGGVDYAKILGVDQEQRQEIVKKLAEEQKKVLQSSKIVSNPDFNPNFQVKEQIENDRKAAAEAYQRIQERNKERKEKERKANKSLFGRRGTKKSGIDNLLKNKKFMKMVENSELNEGIKDKKVFVFRKK